MASLEMDNPGNKGAERIMETLPIEEVKRLLNHNNTNVKTKQTELQLMVGSRYHEIIESADSIVKMKKEAQQVVQLLSDFPEIRNSLLGGAPAPMSKEEVTKLAQAGGVGGKVSSDLAARSPVQIMLAAPSAIWVALDTRSYLEASEIFLRCAAAAEEGLASSSLGTTSAETYLLRGQWAYVEQLSGRIASGAKVVLMQRGLERESYCQALIAIQRVQGISPSETLFLLLQHRTKWILQALRKANRYAKKETLDLSRSRKWLSEAVRNMKQTFQEVYAFFTDGGPLSEGVVQSELGTKLTIWAVQAITTIVQTARKILREIKQARDLTAFQESLTEACKAPDPTSARAEGAGEEEANAPSPTDYSSRIDIGSLLAGLKQDEQLAAWLGRFSQDGLKGIIKDLQLWSLMFSHIFAESAEILLKDSLIKVRENFRARVQSLLTSTKEHQALKSGERPPPHTVFTSAVRTVRTFEAQFRGTLQDATASVHSDEEAYDHFSQAVYARSVDMLACLAHHLRQDLEEAVESGNALGVLTVMKIVWVLSCRAQALEGLLQSPKSAKASPDSISLDQLQAAFEIADTDGNGIMTADEALEGLEAVMIVNNSKVTVDKTLFTSFTFAEFALFSTALLDTQTPFVHFNACLRSLAETASQQWADLVTAGPRERFAKNLLGAAQDWGNFDDESWRKTFGLWEQKPLQIESEAGEELQEKIWFPTSVSLTLSSFLHDVSDEILNMVSVADITQDAMTKFHDESVHKQIVNPLYCAHLNVKNLVFQTISDSYKKLITATQSFDLSMLCESCHLQLLLDFTLLLRVVKQNKSSFPAAISQSFNQIHDSLTNIFDPINLQMFIPQIETNAINSYESSRLFFQIIFNPSDNFLGALIDTLDTPKDQTAGSEFLASSNILPLAQGIQRFNLLPLPIQPMTKEASLARSFLSQSTSINNDGSTSSSLLASDATDSIGSRARSLMGQIGQHSIFASASSFLSSGKK